MAKSRHAAASLVRSAADGMVSLIALQHPTIQLDVGLNAAERAQEIMEGEGTGRWWLPPADHRDSSTICARSPTTLFRERFFGPPRPTVASTVDIGARSVTNTPEKSHRGTLCRRLHATVGSCAAKCSRPHAAPVRVTTVGALLRAHIPHMKH